MYDDTLNVWTNGHHVGYLWRNERKEIGFQYAEEWLENTVRFPISKTLPLKTEAYEPGAENHIAHHYFANLLPEANSRIRICREKKISVDNDFELLRAIGGESNIHNIKRTHWERLADECEISFKLFDTAITHLSSDIIDAFERTQNRFETEHGKYPAFQQIRKALIKNQKLLKRAFE